MIFTLLCIAYLVYDLKDPNNLISLLGLFVFIFICILMSKHPSRVSYNCVISPILAKSNTFLKINFRALAVGILIQYALGVFVLRLEFGYQLFKFFGNRIETFLDFTDNGSELVFGSSFMDHFFAFKVENFTSKILSLYLYFNWVD